MKIKTKTNNIKNGKVNIGVKITHAADCMAVNKVHFEAILRSMHDMDENAFDMAILACIPDFMEGCDDCDD